MKRFFLLFLSLAFIIPINAYCADVNISANCAVVIDSNSKQILFSKSMNEHSPMASTTKIMTCLLACESEFGNKTVTITSEMLDSAIGSLIYLNEGDKISFYDLIKGAMLASGNDAANAIAVCISSNVVSFVKLMNERANEIGMKNTCFVTPSGLDKGNHHSCAYDMALLTSTALNNELFSSICKLKSTEIKINGIERTIYNHNKLLNFNDSCVGVKTGYTDKAGRCLVSAFEYKGNTLIIVTLNAPNDWDDHIKLFNSLKHKYKQRKINNQFQISCVGGSYEKVKCSTKLNIFSVNTLTTKAYYYPFIYAPIKKKDVVGKLEIYDNDMLIKTVDIIVEEDVELWQTTR